jgi:hypothetical protein
VLGTLTGLDGIGPPKLKHLEQPSVVFVVFVFGFLWRFLFVCFCIVLHDLPKTTEANDVFLFVLHANV